MRYEKLIKSMVKHANTMPNADDVQKLLEASQVPNMLDQILLNLSLQKRSSMKSLFILHLLIRYGHSSDVMTQLPVYKEFFIPQSSYGDYLHERGRLFRLYKVDFGRLKTSAALASPKMIDSLIGLLKFAINLRTGDTEVEKKGVRRMVTIEIIIFCNVITNSGREIPQEALIFLNRIKNSSGVNTTEVDKFLIKYASTSFKEDKEPVSSLSSADSSIKSFNYSSDTSYTSCASSGSNRSSLNAGTPLDSPTNLYTCEPKQLSPGTFRPQFAQGSTTPLRYSAYSRTPLTNGGGNNPFRNSFNTIQSVSFNELEAQSEKVKPIKRISSALLSVSTSTGHNNKYDPFIDYSGW